MLVFVKAIGDMLAELFFGKSSRKEQESMNKRTDKKEQPKNSFVTYKFNCWLCSGETRFEVAPTLNESKMYQQECKWCGMDNRVEIKSPNRNPKR